MTPFAWCKEHQGLAGVGADVSAWGGYITGRNLELTPGERIVQSWRTAQFVEEHEDSIITVTLEEAENGTLLTLVHSNVPDDQMSYEQGGWEQHYFRPMKKYFADRIQAETGETSKRTTPRQKRRRAVATASKLSRAKSKAKASKNKSHRRVAASVKTSRAKKTGRKLVKRKRRR
jgi:Activator of Hsp90 ATPase homolog 1-like protein